MTTSGSISTRFRKGQSGNPKGRPKKAKARGPSAFDIVIDRTLTIRQNGRPREVTVDEALQHKTYVDAFDGNRSARRAVLKMIAAREKALAARASAAPTRFEWVDKKDTPRNCDEALLILGIACRDPGKPGQRATDHEPLLLEPWAVAAALKRRAARRLGKSQIDDARSRTKDADGLNWPMPNEP